MLKMSWFGQEENALAYVITAGCIDVLDGACQKVCPVDCIYLGQRSRYIQPVECIDCAACESACPVEAIFFVDELPEELEVYAEDNARFFTDILPGRSEPLGLPGSARKVGAINADTELVVSYRKSGPS